MGYATVVHGGAGSWGNCPAQRVLPLVAAAAEAARTLLAGGGSALEAVVEAVRLMEDEPIFNAGTGSAFNLCGEVEMDAGVMDGSDLSAGAVAALRGVRNPVLVAQKVMEMSDHLLLAGDGALQFARAMGFEPHDPKTAERLDQWQQRGDASASHPATAAQGTVGAVALDRHGRLAAATSTGGLFLKLPGRVGDSPIPGAGNYADAHAAASATGKGELMMRHLTTKAVCDEVRAGYRADEAVARVLQQMAAAFAHEVGLIALDAGGFPGIGHLTAAMPHAFASSRQPQVWTAMRTHSG